MPDLIHAGTWFDGPFAGPVPMSLLVLDLAGPDPILWAVSQGAGEWQAWEVGGTAPVASGDLSSRTPLPDLSPGASLSDTELALLLVDADATTAASRVVHSGAVAWSGTAVPAMSARHDGSDALLLAGAGGGLALHAAAGGTWGAVTELPVGATGDGAGAMARIDIAGTSRIVVVGTDGTVTSWRIDPAGLFHRSDMMAAGDLPLSVPTGIGIGSLLGRTFAVIAAAGSSSLSVLEISETGGLLPRDHLLDDLTTRFGGTTALHVVGGAGRVFVFAAGADAGLTMFTLAPDGRLVFLEALEDDTLMPLDRVTSIEAGIVGSQLHVYTTAEGDAGVGRFTMDLSSAGIVAEGASPIGDAGDDMLLTASGGGIASGGGGDDILLDGSGSDILAGGSGGDLFVLAADGMLDVIEDFAPAEDGLDLTDWAGLYEIAQLGQSGLPGGGLRLTFGEETLDLLPGAGPIADLDGVAVTMLTRIDLPDRSPVAGEVIFGTLGRDDVALSGGTIHASDGDDRIDWAGGAGLVDGGPGIDRVTFAAAATLDLEDSAANAGAAAGLTTEAVEEATGSALADRLSGDDAANRLSGGGGADFLDGRAGNDILLGGYGADSLLGREGEDDIQGGAGADQIAAGDGDDHVQGGPGADTIGGGAGHDMIYGDDGGDEIGGGPGHDWIDGGDEADFISAGWGNDTVFGGAGNDTLAGSYDDDEVRGGEGDDSLGGGTGRDSLFGDAGNDSLGGGDDDDHLDGGAGADFVAGGAGSDLLLGGVGDDQLNGGAGDDILTGGTGADEFIFTSLTQGEVDRITDFEDGTDLIRLHGVSGFGDLTISDGAAGAEVLAQGHRLILEGVSAAELDSLDFVFL